jgi:hypothetical protein
MASNAVAPSASVFTSSLAGDCLTTNCSDWLPGWRPSHTNLLLSSVPSQDSLLTAAGPCYIDSARIAQRTPLPTALLLLRACLLRPLPSNAHCLQSHYLEFENKRRSTTHNKREHNPPTQTRMRIERTYAFENKTRSTTHNKREHNPPTQTHMRIEGTYVLT